MTCGLVGCRFRQWGQACGDNPRPARDICQELTRIIGACGEIDFFTTFGTFVGFVKFVGKYFLGFIAFRTLTGKGLQIFKILESRAMLRCTHDSLLMLVV